MHRKGIPTTSEFKHFLLLFLDADMSSHTRSLVSHRQMALRLDHCDLHQCDQTWPFPATVAVFGVWVAGKFWWWPVAGVAGYYVVLNNQKKF